MAQTMTILGDMGEQPQGDMSVYYQPPPEPENDVQITGGLPINLDSLRDGPPGDEAVLSLFNTDSVRRAASLETSQILIEFYSYAIKGSPNQRLLLEDIYYAIESRVR